MWSAQAMGGSWRRGRSGGRKRRGEYAATGDREDRGVVDPGEFLLPVRGEGAEIQRVGARGHLRGERPDDREGLRGARQRGMGEPGLIDEAVLGVIHLEVEEDGGGAVRGDARGELGSLRARFRRGGDACAAERHGGDPRRTRRRGNVERFTAHVASARAGRRLGQEGADEGGDEQHWHRHQQRDAALATIAAPPTRGRVRRPRDVLGCLAPGMRLANKVAIHTPVGVHVGHPSTSSSPSTLAVHREEQASRRSLARLAAMASRVSRALGVVKRGGNATPGRGGGKFAVLGEQSPWGHGKSPVRLRVGLDWRRGR